MIRPVWLCSFAAGVALAGVPDAPYVGPTSAPASRPVSRIDELVRARLGARGLAPAPLCADEVFFRRVHLDVLGVLPEPAAVLKFVADPAPEKRARLIDELLAHPDFADYWTLKWCDLLRVKAEYPINLWPNAVHAYARWIHTAIRENWPYDRFARALLTASGSNFHEGPANFYRAVQGREPADLAGAVALTFMGVRLERWPKPQREQLAVFFAQVGYKKTAEWKEEIVLWEPRLTKPLEAVLPGGQRVVLTPDDDPRRVFARWLITPENPYFTKTIANRVWSWLLGRGIVHEPDDFRADNPPTHPELLDYLAQQLVGDEYDLRKLMRLILNSDTYQQAPTPAAPDAAAERFFACYPVRRLEAEVLADALCWLSGSGEKYTSMIPEPFTYIPEGQRSVELADGSITSPFLEMFGRPSRDTGLETERNNAPSDAQRLHFLNSSDIQKKLERSPRLRKAVDSAKGDSHAIVRGLYLTILSRYPKTDELDRAAAYFATPGVKARDAAADVAWALINTKEFLYRH